VQTQSYGAQQRGGLSLSDVIISDEEIDYPKVLAADLLVALSQNACDRFYHSLARQGILIVDSSMVTRVPTSRAWRLPITETAKRVAERPVVANIVALGVLSALSNIVSWGAIRAAVLARAPRGTEELNLRALEAGREAAQAAMRETSAAS
jgi:2-oxoglutarate ferredoxin oxidoreductase subunit gamma